MQLNNLLKFISPSNKGYEAADFTYEDNKNNDSNDSRILGLTSASRMF